MLNIIIIYYIININVFTKWCMTRIDIFCGLAIDLYEYTSMGRAQQTVWLFIQSHNENKRTGEKVLHNSVVHGAQRSPTVKHFLWYFCS